MKHKKLIILIAMTALITFFSGFFFYNNLIILETHNIPATIEVSKDKMIGLNPEPDKFDFGIAPRKSVSVRRFNVTNGYEHEIKLNIQSEGELTKWIILSDNNFVIKKGKTKEIIIEAHVPSNAEFKKYNSTMKFVFIRKWS